MEVATQLGRTRTRKRLALVALGALSASSVPALIYLTPAWPPRHPVLLGALAAIAICAYFGQVSQKTNVALKLDGGFAMVLIAVALSGPVAGVAIFLTWDLVSRLIVREHRVFTPGALANLASYCWAAVAAAGVIKLGVSATLTAHAGPELFAAGIAMVIVQFGIARLVYGTLYQGYRPGDLVRGELPEVLSVGLVDVLIGTLTAILIGPLGVGALLLLAPVVLIPSVALPALARSKSVARLDLAQATALYAAALADQLHLSRNTRRIVFGGSYFLHTRTFGRHPRISELNDMGLAAMYAAERWDGTGSPARLRGGLIPIESRILAVATQWASLTAKGTQQLPHTEALLALELVSSTGLDPRVVIAAGEIVNAELPWASDAAFQPVLHRLPLPRLVRRNAIPHALGGHATSA
jgi:hypothetical protein